VSEGYYPEEVMEHIKDKKELGRSRMKGLYSFTVQSSPSVHGRGEMLKKYLLHELGMVGKNIHRKVSGVWCAGAVQVINYFGYVDETRRSESVDYFTSV